MISQIFILVFCIQGSYGQVSGSANSKLKKTYRNTITIIDQLLNTAVTKEEHAEAMEAALANRIGLKKKSKN